MNTVTMCTVENFGRLLDPGDLASMAKKTMTEKVNELGQSLEDLEHLKNQYRTQAVTAEIEVIRLNQKRKELQEDLAALQLQNSKLVDRIIGLLQQLELKES